MRTLLLAGGLLVLSGCSLLMPTPDPNRAWVDLDTQPDADLAAVEVDDKSWDRTRYFEVDPGTRELTVRYQFTVDPTNIGPVTARSGAIASSTSSSRTSAPASATAWRPGTSASVPGRSSTTRTTGNWRAAARGAARRSERRKARALC